MDRDSKLLAGVRVKGFSTGKKKTGIKGYFVEGLFGNIVQ